MASEKQITANRRNAAKSTGPKSTSGKENVRMNALKHGLQAKHAVIPGEDPGDYEALYNGLKEDWQPIGTREILLFEEIVNGWWLVKRAWAISTAIMRKEQSLLEQARTKRREDKRCDENPEVVSKEADEFIINLFHLLNARKKIRENRRRYPDQSITYGDGAVEFSVDELEDDHSTLAVAYQRSGKKLEMLSRYETGILRRLRNTERELERLQTLRIDQAAADATVIDAMDVKRKKN